MGWELMKRGTEARSAQSYTGEDIESQFGNAPGMSGSQHVGEFLWTLLAGALVLALLTPGVAFAQERTSEVGPALPAPPQAAPIGPPAPEEPKQFLNWEMRPGRSYVIPAVEILAYLFLLNQFDRHFTEPEDVYRVTPSTFRQHVTDGKWVIDDDQFSVNQFLHPYGGTVYFGLARSAGLNFWESFLYAAAGSFLWELGGEKTTPFHQRPDHDHLWRDIPGRAALPNGQPAAGERR